MDFDIQNPHIVENLFHTVIKVFRQHDDHRTPDAGHSQHLPDNSLRTDLIVP